MRGEKSFKSEEISRNNGDFIQKSEKKIFLKILDSYFQYISGYEITGNFSRKERIRLVSDIPLES